MNRKPKLPRFILDEQWAIDTDSRNWILYSRIQTKAGKLGQWGRPTFYPNAAMCLKSLYNKLQTDLDPNLPLVEHIEYAHRYAQELSDRFFILVQEWAKENQDVLKAIYRPKKIAEDELE